MHSLDTISVRVLCRSVARGIWLACLAGVLSCAGCPTVDTNSNSQTNDDPPGQMPPDEDDLDGDGVANGEDDCPATIAGAVVDEFGCSPAQRDSDNDGVSDDIDECPDTTDADSVDGLGCADDQRDSDGDGVVDSDDLCPTTVDAANVDDDGCAPGERDADGDGVSDADDECPGTMASVTVDEAGCGPGQRDSDDDGVSDDADDCPDTAAGEDVDDSGCSADQQDLDEDGVPNGDDACPGTAANADVDENGCADSQLDSDDDGVTDDLDDCPNTPAGFSVDATGCPCTVNADCDDDNACTDDICNADGSCSHPPQNHDDGLFCNGVEVCNPATGAVTSPGNPCNGQTCDEGQNACVSVCGNGTIETGETCDPPVCGVCASTCQAVNVGGTPTWAAAFAQTSDSYFSAVWGSGPNDVFVVGGTNANQAHVRHFDGQNWTTMSPPGQTLIWVYGFGPGNVYAVGYGGTVVHYNGSSWSSLTSGTTDQLWGVWGTAANNLWIVGGDPFNSEALILHYNGTTFTPVATPAGAGTLFKVWGIGSKVFAVGQDGLIIEYVAGQWQNSPITSGGGSPANDDFVSLWGTSESNIVAVGGRATGQIAYYNGATWTTMLTGGEGLNAVFMVRPNQAIIGGNNGAVASFNPMTSGISYENSTTARTIHGLWSDCDGTFYGVGGQFNPPFLVNGVAVERTLE